MSNDTTTGGVTPDATTGGAQTPDAATAAAAGNADQVRTFDQSFVDGLNARHKRSKDQAVRQAEQRASSERDKYLADKLGVPVSELDSFLEQRAQGQQQQTQQTDARVARLQEQLAEQKAEVSRIQQAADDREILARVVTAGNAAKCNDCELLHLALKSELRLVNNEVIVMGKDKQPTGQTLEERIADLLAAKPHLKQASASNGAGSRAGSGPLAGAASFDMTSPKGRKAYLEWAAKNGHL